MTKRQGVWRASWRCKMCGGTGKVPSFDDPEVQTQCLTCKKGWVETSGHVT